MRSSWVTYKIRVNRLDFHLLAVLFCYKQSKKYCAVTPILQLARLSGFTVGSFVSNESVVDDGELLFSPSGNLFFGNLVDSGNTLFLFLRRRRIVVLFVSDLLRLYVSIFIDYLQFYRIC